MSEYQPSRDWLIFRLSDFVIQNLVDVGALFDEIENIQEDYPDQFIVFAYGDQNGRL